MSEYKINHTGAELDDAISKFKSGYIDKSKITNFATGEIKNVTAGQRIEASGIVDVVSGEKFDLKGVLLYVQPDETTTVYPLNHAAECPAVFCVVRDDRSGFGVAMVCNSTDGNVREVRMNIATPFSRITFDENSFSYTAADSMYGLIAADSWRWVAWG